MTDTDDADIVTDAPIVITAKNKSKTYNGQPLYWNGGDTETNAAGTWLALDTLTGESDYFTVSNNLKPGDWVEVQIAGTVTHVSQGEVANVITDHKILRMEDGQLKDVTSAYSAVRIPGALKILPLDVTLIADSDTKEYDGTPLNDADYMVCRGKLTSAPVDGAFTGAKAIIGSETISARTSGTQTNVGSSDNVIVESSVTVAGEMTDYTFHFVDGDLVVTGAPYIPEKTHGEDYAGEQLGKYIVFTITVDNVSDIELTNVLVEDNNAVICDASEVQGAIDYVKTGDHTATIASIPVGESRVVYAKHLVTEEDIIADEITNTADVKYDGYNVPATDHVTTDDPDPKLVSSKVELGLYNEGTNTYTKKDVYTVGDEVFYKATVTNTGNLTITDITLDDSLVEWTEQPFTLKPGETYEWIYSYTVTLADLGENGVLGKVTNKLNVTGESPDDPDDPDEIPDPEVPEETVTIDTAIKLTIVANDNDVRYNGMPHGKNPAEPWFLKEGSALEAGHTLAKDDVTVSGSETAIGHYVDELVPSDATIMSGKTDVTDHYYITYENGDLTIRAPKIDVDKTMPESSDEVRTGEIITYTITVVNEKRTAEDGKDISAVANGVTVQEQLPTNATLVGNVVCSQGSYNASKQLWTVGTLAVGQTATMTITMRVNNDVENGDHVKNHVVAKVPNNPDPDPEGGTDSDVKTPDLKVTKTIAQPKKGASVRCGDTVTYNVTVANNGLEKAVNVKMKDVVPAGLKDITLDGAAKVLNAKRELLWTVPEIGVGQSVTFTISATVTVEDVRGTIGENWVYITGENNTPTDPTDPDNRDNTPEIPVKNPDLKVTKTVSEKQVYYLDELTYTIQVTNNGAAAAKDVLITDRLPAGLELVKTEMSAGVRNETTKAPNMIFRVANLEPGKSVTIKLIVKVIQKGPAEIAKNVVVIPEENGKPTDPDDPDLTDETPPVKVRCVTVTFVDWNGRILKKVTLNIGDSTFPPPDPYRTLWEFDFWDGRWWDVYQDEIVYARYKPIIPKKPDHYGIIIDADIPLAGGYMTTVGDCFD